MFLMQWFSLTTYIHYKVHISEQATISEMKNIEIGRGESPHSIGFT